MVHNPHLRHLHGHLLTNEHFQSDPRQHPKADNPLNPGRRLHPGLQRPISEHILPRDLRVRLPLLSLRVDRGLRVGAVHVGGHQR